MVKLEKLFQPSKIGPMELPNRIIMVAVTTREAGIRLETGIKAEAITDNGIRKMHLTCSGGL